MVVSISQMNTHDFFYMFCIILHDHYVLISEVLVFLTDCNACFSLILCMYRGVQQSYHVFLQNLVTIAGTLRSKGAKELFSNRPR